MLKEQIEISLPKLPISSEQYSHGLAVERESQFEMSNLINNTKQYTKMYQSLAHKLAETVLLKTDDDSAFNIFSVMDWLAIATSIGLIVALSWIFVLSLRLKACLVVMATMQGSEANSLIPTRLAYATLSTPVDSSAPTFWEYWKAFNTEMTQLLSLEMAMCVVVLLLVCVVGWRLHIKMTGFYDSNLIIIIGNEVQEVHIPVMKLRYPLTFYQFHVSSSQWNVSLINSLLYSKLFWGHKYLQVKTYHDMLQIALPEKISLQLWTARSLRNILKRRYYVVIKITDMKSKIKDLIIVRSLLQEYSASVGQADNKISDTFIHHQPNTLMYALTHNYRNRNSLF